MEEAWEYRSILSETGMRRNAMRNFGRRDLEGVTVEV